MYKPRPVFHLDQGFCQQLTHTAHTKGTVASICCQRLSSNVKLNKSKMHKGLLDLSTRCFWIKPGLTYETLTTKGDDKVIRKMARFRKHNWFGGAYLFILTYCDSCKCVSDVSFAYQSQESSCTAQALLRTMTGLFPSALFQTLWRRTRCLSVRLFFFFYLINFACVVFLKSWHKCASGARVRKAFCEAFSASFVTIALQSELARHGKNKRLPTTILDHFILSWPMLGFAMGCQMVDQACDITSGISTSSYSCSFLSSHFPFRYFHPWFIDKEK